MNGLLRLVLLVVVQEKSYGDDPDVELARGKRIRRDPSAANVNSVLSEGSKRRASVAGESEEDGEETPDFVKEELLHLVAEIKAARPVGGQSHLVAVHKLRHILSTCAS